MSPIIIILAIASALLAIKMLVAKNAITSALCLLGILLTTAGIYAMIGEHLVATVQLVVYAGAIMVLFIFSIMLLNLSQSEDDFKKHPAFLAATVAFGLIAFGAIAYAVNEHFLKHSGEVVAGSFTHEKIEALGGNSKVLSHALFSQYYVSFEIISLALLVAIVGAVVLAKRKVD